MDMVKILDKSVSKIYGTAVNEFKALCKIPHVSNDVEKENFEDHLVPYRKYLTEKVEAVLGKGCVTQDKVGNMWFDIPASQGCENYQKIVLQAHMDMVWDAQGEAQQWDKWTHPIAEPVKETVGVEEVIHTKDYLTTLGADDGQGIALILSFTQHKDLFTHGPIRCIMTTDEEPGVYGAQKIGIMADGKTINVLEGFTHLINIDNAVRNQVITCSAGAHGHNYYVEKFETEDTNSVITIGVKGLQGGHSGANIDDGFANAVKLVNNVLRKCNGEIDANIKLISFKTPNTEVNNKIPKEAIVEFTCSKTDQEIKTIFDMCISKDKIQYRVEKDIELTFKHEQKAAKCIKDPKISDGIIRFIDELFYGPITYFPDNFIQTSSNVAPVNLDLTKNERQLTLCTYSRSADNKQMADLKKHHEGLYKVYMSAIPTVSEEQVTEFAAWEYKENNPLMAMCVNAYTKLGIKPVVAKCHAGLECSYFAVVNPNINQISIGPLVEFEHSFKETLHLYDYYNIAQVIIDICKNAK